MQEATPAAVPMPMRWDLFCRVIDNFGDIGVCWRLAADLGARGQSVRLWIDDARALAWMAPDGARGVQVLPWIEGVEWPEPGEVVVEAFGCDLPPAFIARMSGVTRRRCGSTSNTSAPRPMCGAAMACPRRSSAARGAA